MYAMLTLIYVEPSIELVPNNRPWLGRWSWC